MKNGLTLILVLCSVYAFSQDSTSTEKKPNPLRNYGIYASVEYSNVRVDWDPFTVDNDGTPGSIAVKNGFAGAAGVFYWGKVNRWLVLRPAVGASFSTGELQYDLDKYYTNDYQIHPFTANVQLHMLIPANYLRKSASDSTGIKGFTPILGPSIYIAIEEIPTIHPDVEDIDYHIDFGFGYQHDTWKMNTHIDFIFSLSLTNIIGTKEDIFTTPVNSLYRDSFSVRFYFH